MAARICARKLVGLSLLADVSESQALNAPRYLAFLFFLFIRDIYISWLLLHFFTCIMQSRSVIGVKNIREIEVLVVALVAKKMAPKVEEGGGVEEH